MIDRPLLAKRLKEAYAYLKSKAVVHTQAEFAAMLGKQPTDLSNAMAAKGRVMTGSFLEHVADTFPEYLNKHYLMTGEGEIANISRTMRPHIEAKASAGFMDVISEGKAELEMRPMIPGMKAYNFTIKADGDSMLPRIEDGDTLLCRMLRDRQNPPIGKICVVDTVDGVFVKQITEADDETVTLHSLNPAHSDRVMTPTSILGIAEVVGLVREF